MSISKKRSSLASVPLFVVAMLLFVACNQANNSSNKGTADSTNSTNSSNDTAKSSTGAPKKIANAATILARPEVPILCYHQIRDWTAKDSKGGRDFIVPTAVFKEHLKVLADSGYHTILPDQLYDYLTTGAPLPSKPFMLTYDDTDIDQFTIANPEMKKYGFKGVFFIMTVSLNRPPHYMSRDQVKQLSDEGNVVESHTWDHHKFTTYLTDKDWETQVDKPRKQIEELTGKKADYFAYPYGLWNKAGIPELKKRGIKAAFQLSTKRDPDEPLYTIRRMIASGFWSGQAVYKNMVMTFAKK